MIRLRLLAVVPLAALGIVYGVDYASISWKVRSNQQPFADIVVDQVYTSTNKWKEVVWSRGVSVNERCVYSLFPHFGNRPCWYVRRHTMNITNTD
jgi:hypothetical protein